MWSTIRKIAGFVLIAIGLVAMPFPIVPGIPIVLAGLALLGSDHALVRRCRKWLQERGLWKKGNGNDLPDVQS